MKYLLTLLFCASAFGADVGEQQQGKAGSVGQWLSPGSFTSAKMYDVSQFDNHGTINGSMVFVRNRQAIALSGSPQHGRIPKSTTLSPGTGDFTITLWFYRTGAASYQELIRKYGATAFPTAAIYLNADGKLGMLYRDSNNNSVAFGDGTTGVGPVTVAGAWNHVAWVRKNTTATYYLNGVAITNGTNVSLSNVDLTGGSSWNIGRFAGATDDIPGQYFIGRLALYRFFSRYLSPAEVAALYKGELR